MRLPFYLLCTLGLMAAEPLRIVAVERQGLPPYEDDHRIYRLQGQGHVSPGEILELARPGGRALPGRLRVLQTTAGGALATLERRGDTYPLKGDIAVHYDLATLPGLPRAGVISAVPEPSGSGLAIPKDPRQLREALYFLPGDATLSPLGRAKLEAWVRECGAGHWTLEIPAPKGPQARVVAARVKTLKAALEHLGVKGVQIRTAPATPSSQTEAVLVRYQETPPAKVLPSRKV